MEQSENLKETLPRLRALRRRLPDAPGRAVDALRRVGSLWEARLHNGWFPPPGSPFPWAQVRRSLAALLPGLEALAPGRGDRTEKVAALILAGNTPLLAWPALSAALAAGLPVIVKMSRDETLWAWLFVETLAEADPAMGELVSLETWRGEDPRTGELLRQADAVIAYGSDAALASLRHQTPSATPFFGFGHALSVGLICKGADLEAAAYGFALDTLMYRQMGCLSPQALFLDLSPAAVRALTAEFLPAALRQAAEELEVEAVQDIASAGAIRRARDLALFDGWEVTGDPELRWTLALTDQSLFLPDPVGQGFLSLLPFACDRESLPGRWGKYSGAVSSVGVAGDLPSRIAEQLVRAGVSRICPAGTMQTPPLDWQNGNMDLFAEMANLALPG